MHSGHWHVEAQWGSQQVQVHPSSVWLHQQGPQRRGKTTEHRGNVEASIHLFTVVVCAANDDPDQSERHIQRGPAHGGGWALAGLSFTGILQPGTDSCWTLSRHFKVTIWFDAVFWWDICNLKRDVLKRSDLNSKCFGSTMRLRDGPADFCRAETNCEFLYRHRLLSSCVRDYNFRWSDLVGAVH